MSGASRRPQTTFALISSTVLDAALLIYSLALMIVWIFHLLLVNARYCEPFNRGAVNRLNLMGSLILIPWLLTSNWWNAVTQWFGPRQEFNLTIPFTQGGTMPVNGFVMALLIFGMAEVFRRDVQLREEQGLTV